MTRRTITVFTISLVASSSGCGGDTSSANPTSGADMASDGFEAQVTRGQAAYGENCAQCHGASGEGTPTAPPLVGDGALPKEPRPDQTVRTESFVTAFDVYDFARTNMPANAPGSLDSQTYLNIVAFDLFANGLSFEKELGEQELKEITINP